MEVISEDGVRLNEGDRAFNYYDGKWGTIGEIDADGWFTFAQDDGTRTVLNGQRIAITVPPGGACYDKWLEGK